MRVKPRSSEGATNTFRCLAISLAQIHSFLFFCLFFFFFYPLELRNKPRALCLLGNCTTTELNSQPLSFLFFFFLKKKNLVTFIYCLCMFTHECGGQKAILGSQFSFYHVHSGTGTQVIRLVPCWVISPALSSFFF